MTKEEVFEFVTKNPVFSLATIEGSQPRVRMMMLYKADTDGIIFCTGRNKAVYKQLQSNPAAELCFYNAEQGLQVRIEGTVEMLEDLELKKQVVEAFPFLKPWVESEGYEVMVICRLQNARAITWTMETNYDPKEYIQL